MLYGTGNWVVKTDLSNALNIAKRTDALKEVTAYTPGLTPFVAKYFEEAPAFIFFEICLEESCELDSTSGVQQSDGQGLSLFFLTLQSGVGGFRNAYDGIGMTEITDDAVAVTPLQHELKHISIATEPSACHPEGIIRRQRRSPS